MFPACRIQPVLPALRPSTLTHGTGLNCGRWGTRTPAGVTLTSVFKTVTLPLCQSSKLLGGWELNPHVTNYSFNTLSAWGDTSQYRVGYGIRTHVTGFANQHLSHSVNPTVYPIRQRTKLKNLIFFGDQVLFFDYM